MAGPLTLYQTGVHGSRPAASSGCVLYSCTTHSLVYKSDGSSWTTFLTIPTGSGVATDPIWDAAGDLAVGTGADTATKLSIGAADKVLKSNGTTASWAYPTLIGAKAYSSATQAITATTITACTLNAEEFDTNAFHDNVTNNSRMTIPVTGYYRLTGGVFFPPDTASDPQFSAWFRIGGSTNVRGGALQSTVVGTPDLPSLQGTISATVALTAAQYVELMVYSWHAVTIGSASAESQTTLTVEFLGV